MKLYEIKNEYLGLLEKFREAEDEQELALIADDLENMKGELNEKLENCARVYRTLEAESEIYAQESNRLKGKSNILKNRAERLKDYIALVLGPGNKAKTELFDFTWRKSQSVEIEHSDWIPAAYMRTKVISEPDKILIKQDLQIGAEIPGVKLVDRLNLQIK